MPTPTLEWSSNPVCAYFNNNNYNNNNNNTTSECALPL
uniref:Uncharacterized protein n=1 Tax=Anguilla anguilla TaxID=7936 RepID=A0A0E9TPW1_ANGAN